MWVALLAEPPLGTSVPVNVALGFFANIMAFRTVGGAVINPALGFGIWATAMIHGAQKHPAATLLLWWVFELLGSLIAGLVAGYLLRRNKKAA